MTTKTATFTTTPYNGVPLFIGTNIQEWSYHARNTINANLNGKLNSKGTVTLAESVTTTTVKLPSGMLANDSVVMYYPLTATAATEFGAGSLFMSARDVANSTFTLTHANTSDTDKIFAFVLIG